MKPSEVLVPSKTNSYVFTTVTVSVSTETAHNACLGMYGTYIYIVGMSLAIIFFVYMLKDIEHLQISVIEK